MNEPQKLKQLRDVNCQQANEDLLQEFLKDLRIAGRSGHTITSYGGTCKDFLNFVCGLKITQATHHEVRQWLHWMQSRGLSPQTLAQRKYALSSFFKFLERIGMIASSPTRLVPNHKTRRHLPRYHSVEEMNKLLAACDNIRDLALLSTLWATGCRRAELVGMKIEDVNWTERTVCVTGKGDKQRLVPLTLKAIETLMAHIAERKTGPIFLSENHRCLANNEIRGLGSRDLDRIIKKVCLRAGIDATHPHAFRHSFATHMLEGGADLITVKEFLGHSSLTSTQIYTHPSAEFMRKTMERCHPACSAEGVADAQARTE